MDIHDLKKLALLGICSGMMIAAASSNALFAESDVPSNGGEVKSEESGSPAKPDCPESSGDGSHDMGDHGMDSGAGSE